MMVYGYCCFDCKNWDSERKICRHMEEFCKEYGFKYGLTCPEFFVCDFFRRKNSGAYRRKLKRIITCVKCEHYRTSGDLMNPMKKGFCMLDNHETLESFYCDKAKRIKKP